MTKYIFTFLLLTSCLFDTVAQDNILLITPYDKDTIDTKNPLLSWMYLGGAANTNGRVFYRIIIVELQEDQSAEAGIIVNPPLVKMDEVPGTQLFYPYDAPELEEGHRYGWQLQKISNNILVDKSEAWEFILPLPEVPKPHYYRMKRKNDGNSYTAVDGKLYFHFDERYADDDLEFFIYDARHKQLEADVVFEEGKEEGENVGEINVKRTGSNFYQIDLGDFAVAGTYNLVVLDAKKQKYELKFIVK